MVIRTFSYVFSLGHLGHSGELFAMGWRPSLCVLRRLLTSSSQERLSLEIRIK